MSGAEIAAEVAAALAEVGDETGDGPLLALIIRPGAITDETVYPPVKAGDTGTLFTAMIGRWEHRELASGNVKTGDIKVILETGEFEPTPDHKIRLNGRRYDIVDVMNVAPAGETLMWKVQARGGVPDTATYPVA